jgi:hypothetical protein
VRCCLVEKQAGPGDHVRRSGQPRGACLDGDQTLRVGEAYWFGTEPSDPEANAVYLGKNRKWAARHDRPKQRDVYVGLDKTGAAMTPAHTSPTRTCSRT